MAPVRSPSQAVAPWIPAFERVKKLSGSQNRSISRAPGPGPSSDAIRGRRELVDAITFFVIPAKAGTQFFAVGIGGEDGVASQKG
jgi:hypothetical protein